MTSICITSFQRPDLLRDLLKSLESTLPEKVGLFVHCTDESEYSEMLSKANSSIFDPVELIHDPIPRGFSISMNRILLRAIPRRENFLLLNDDMLTPAKDWYSILKDFMKSNSNVGAIQPVVSQWINEKWIIIPPSYPANAQIPEEELQRQSWYQKDLYDVTFSGGGISMVRWEALAKTGLFDERYGPGYYEDFDLGIRMWLAGYRCCITPKTFIRHYGVGTTYKVFPGFWPTENCNYHQKKWEWMIGTKEQQKDLDGLIRTLQTYLVKS